MKKAFVGLCLGLGFGGTLLADDGPAARLGAPKPAAQLGKPVTKPATYDGPILPIQGLDRKPTELPAPMPAGPLLSNADLALPQPVATSATSIPVIPIAPLSIKSLTEDPLKPADVAKQAEAPKSTTPVPLPAPAAVGAPVTSVPVYGQPYYNNVPVQQGIPIQQGVPVVAGPVTDVPVSGGHGWLGIHGSPLITDRNCLYGSFEGVFMRTKAANVPTLVTTGPQGSNGVIGNPGVTSLLSSSDVFDNKNRAGARLNFGFWFGADKRQAVDFVLFGLGQQGVTNSFASTGTPLLARPFFSANRGAESSEIVAANGLSSGRIGITTDSSFYGGEVNYRKKWIEDCKYSVDWLVGYRHLTLQESLGISESVTGVPGGPFAGVAGTISDNFQTTNNFNGVNIGTIFECRKGRWTFGATGKVALGVNSSSTEISGGTTQSGSVVIPVTTPGGLYALNSNIGKYNNNAFSVVPEVAFNIGYNVNTHCRVFLGYNALFMTNVLRPGDQIDRTIDENRAPILNQMPGIPAAAGARPAYPNKDTTFWAQGVSAGVVFSW